MKTGSMFVAIGFAVALASGAQGAEIRVLSSNAVKTALEELAPRFEKATEHKLAFTFGTAVGLKGDIEKGAAVDVAILTASAVDDLIKQGKIAGSRTDLVRSSSGMAVRKGAPKPDISTTEAFKRTLLEAKSIAYVEQGGTGIYLKGLLERLGIADEVKPKTRLLPSTNPAAQAVANGEAEIGMTQISEILPYAGAELVGPLPAEIQLYTVFSAGTGTNAKEHDAAKTLIKFLTSPDAAPVFKAKGLEPAR
ncbi:MAG: molybdate ABC transporter substrate-binding protein [Xanthobacteraceae bacterium]